MSASAEGNDLEARVARILTEEILPALQMDGQDLELVQIADGVVRVRLHGTCSGCPSSLLAVVMGIEQELRRRIPEIDYLEAVP